MVLSSGNGKLYEMILNLQQGQHRLEGEPASGRRDWMGATNQHFVHRCAPLSIADASRWGPLNQHGQTVIWPDDNGTNDIIARIHEPGVTHRFISSTVGHGIVSFHPGFVFRTGPDYRPGDVIFAKGRRSSAAWSMPAFRPQKRQKNP